MRAAGRATNTSVGDVHGSVASTGARASLTEPTVSDIDVRAINMQLPVAMKFVALGTGARRLRCEERVRRADDPGR